MYNAEWKLNIQDIQEDTYPTKKESVDGQLATVKYRSERYYWTQKLNTEDYGVASTFFFFLSRLRFEIEVSALKE